MSAVKWLEWRHAVAILGTCAFIALALERLGYRIIERRYRSRFGEIDVVAAQEGVARRCQHLENVIGQIQQGDVEGAAEAAPGNLTHHAVTVDPVGHGEGIVNVLAAALHRDQRSLVLPSRHAHHRRPLEKATAIVELRDGERKFALELDGIVKAWRKQGLPRAALLDRVAHIDGAYVPFATHPSKLEQGIRALPALGAAYGIPTIIDQELDAQPEIYFEAGDHEHMVHMTQAEFSRATSELRRAHFSRIDAGLGRVSGGDTC